MPEATAFFYSLFEKCGLGTRTLLSGARIIEAIAGAISAQAVSSAVARIRLQKFLVGFPTDSWLVILVAVLMIVSLAT